MGLGATSSLTMSALAAGAAARAEEAVGAAPSLQVLLVEDHPVNQTLATRLLEK